MVHKIRKMLIRVNVVVILEKAKANVVVLLVVVKIKR
jgi:hypothetical protein